MVKPILHGEGVKQLLKLTNPEIIPQVANVHAQQGFIFTDKPKSDGTFTIAVTDGSDKGIEKVGQVIGINMGSAKAARRYEVVAINKPNYTLRPLGNRKQRRRK